MLKSVDGRKIPPKAITNKWCMACQHFLVKVAKEPCFSCHQKVGWLKVGSRPLKKKEVSHSTSHNKSSPKLPKWAEVEKAVCPFDGVHSAKLKHAGAKECYEFIAGKIGR